jgi:hypothetical protein
MQTVEPTGEGFTQVGGHTFRVSHTDATTKKTVELLEACQKCHGPRLTTFNFRLMDYDEDGKIEGIQTEIQNLLDRLSALLPPTGQPKTSLTINSTWTRTQLEGGFNWNFVAEDGSRGIHNTAYAVGLLKASIDALEAEAKK